MPDQLHPGGVYRSQAGTRCPAARPSAAGFLFPAHVRQSPPHGGQLLALRLRLGQFSKNKTMRELHDLIKSGTGIDPLKDFSEAARDELRAFTSL